MGCYPVIVRGENEYFGAGNSFEKLKRALRRLSPIMRTEVCLSSHTAAPMPFSGTTRLAPPHCQQLPGTEDRSAKDQWPESGRFRDNGGNGVVIQSHGTGQSQGAAGHACPRIEGDACVSENIALE
jgi:hypothetical protein